MPMVSKSLRLIGRKGCFISQLLLSQKWRPAPLRDAGRRWAWLVVETGMHIRKAGFHDKQEIIALVNDRLAEAEAETEGRSGARV